MFAVRIIQDGLVMLYDIFEMVTIFIRGGHETCDLTIITYMQLKIKM